MRVGVSCTYRLSPRPYHGGNDSNIRTVLPGLRSPPGEIVAMTTTQEQWLPLGVDADEASEFTALREDVPDYLYRSLWTWIFGKFSVTLNASSGSGFNVGLARQCERVLKISIADAGKYADGSFRAVQDAVDGPPMLTWRLVDFLLSVNYSRVSGAQGLDTMLLESGSAWKVGERSGKVGLERRLPEGVVDAAQSAFQHPNAGKRLAAAWEAVFGVNPDPSNGYRLAVVAVEDAAIPVVPTGKAEPTLGDVIRAIDNGTWRLPHLREHQLAPSHNVLVSMLRLLWRGHHDRHGGPSTVGVPAVTQPEAESAVMLAVTLVGWFETGKVAQ